MKPPPLVFDLNSGMPWDPGVVLYLLSYPGTGDSFENRSLVPIFILLVFVAGALEYLVSTAWIVVLFGEGRCWGVPAAAALYK